MFVIVCLLIASSAFAQLQSGPSNKVGYVKIAVATGTQASPSNTAFGLPFQFWTVNVSNIPVYGTESWKPSNIVGDQLNHGTISSADRIQKQGVGDFAWFRSSDNTWQGTLETGGAGMGLAEPGRAYWYINKSGVARTLVLAGEVNNNGTYDTLAVNFPTAPSPAFANTPLSWRDARIVDRTNLNLLAQGWTDGLVSTADRVQIQGAGDFFYHRSSDNTWQGTLTSITPGKAYWIINRHQNHAWNYIYNASGAPAPTLQGQKAPEVRDIQKVTPPASKTTVRTVKARSATR